MAGAELAPGAVVGAFAESAALLPTLGTEEYRTVDSGTGPPADPGAASGASVAWLYVGCA